MATVSPERLAKIYSETNLTFIECFNNISDNQRIVLFFDTIDALKGTETLNYLLKMVSQLENYLVLMAGRNASDFGCKLQHGLGKDIVQIIDLPPLQQNAGKDYFMEKQKLLHIELELS